MIARLLWVVALFSLVIASPAFAQNIDTRAAATGTLGACCYGPGLPNSIGQTFTVPVGQTGVGSFSIRSFSIPPTSTLRGVLMQWDTGTNRAIGPVLYQSADVNTTGVQDQDITFTIPGSVPVTAGQTYVIFLSGVNSAGTGAGSLRGTPVDSLAGGTGAFQLAPSQADWTASAWSTTGSNDIGVTVNFAVAAVPTLSEWALIVFGLMLAGGAALYLQRREMAV